MANSSAAFASPNPEIRPSPREISLVRAIAENPEFRHDAKACLKLGFVLASDQIRHQATNPKPHETRRNPFLGTLAALTAMAMTQSAHAASVTWNVAGGGTWDTSTGNWTGGSPTANLYVNGDTANFTNTAGGTINLSGTIAPAATNVSAASGTYTFTGTGITSGTLTKTGAGTLILQNSNSHSGTTTVRGALTINSGGAITGGGALTIGGSTSPTGTVQYDSAATSTFGAIVVGSGNDGTGNSILNQTAGTINASSLTLNNAFTTAGAGDVNLSGGLLAVSGTVTASNQVAADNTWSTITISNDASLTIGNGLRLTGAPSTGRYAAGRVTQEGGSVTVSNGLNMARTTASNTAARRGEYNLNGGTLTVNQISQDVGTDTFGTFNFNGGTLKPTANNTDFMEGLTTAQIMAGGAKIDTNGKSITIAQSLTQDAAGRTLLKDGLGTLTLSGASSYSGATTISQGKLIMGDAALDTFATSEVTVASGATLGGSGTISGTLGVTGILAPGIADVNGGIGTLKAGTTTWKGASSSVPETIWQFDLSASAGSSDTLAITGDFKMDSTAGSVYKFNFMNSAPAAWGNAYTLVTWTGATDFTNINQFSWTGLGGAYNGLDSYFTLDTANKNSLSPPSPSPPVRWLVS